MKCFPALRITLLSSSVVLLLSFIYIVSFGGGGGGGGVAVSSPSVTLTGVVSGLNQPVSITHAGDGSGRLFIVERTGIIRIMKDGAVLPTPFLDITALVQSTGGEQGLLGLAFPPNFASSRHFYVNYTNRTGTGNTVVARYQVTTNPDVADVSSGVSLLTVTQPFENHNGGQLAFGPDGFLYIGMGDGGSGGDPFGNAQNLSTLLGKILRIDTESGGVPYAIPPGNPLGNEIWAQGLRNPWRFSFDRATNDLYIADVGEDQFEEVNFQPASSSGGENYGWNIMEGFNCFNNLNCNRTGLTLPVHEYSHQTGDCAIIGGFVYRGAQYPAIQGTYIYGDFCSGRIWGLKRNGAVWSNMLLADSQLQIACFGEDETGNLFVADISTGTIFKIDIR
jgi:glucose/arabinose dehydrogenase